ncbi:MAG: alpha/beta hydrolase [Acidimicrobiales bacterium]|nr:alpha/beta hydrolase [Acidimicrobiales bacterium]
MTERATAMPAVWIGEHGTGPRVVLVHGTMDRSSSFGRVSRVLDDLRVIRYDRRGYGRSVETGPPVSFDQQVDDLLDVLGGEPAVVFGHSYGGTIALGAAARAPEPVRSVGVYECPLPWMPWWPTTSAGASAVAAAKDPSEAAERFMRRLIGDRRWERLPPSTRDARRAEGPTLVAEMANLRTGEAPFRLADISVPVVASNGSEGVAHHARSARAVAAGVADGEHHVVEGVGHGIHLTHPAELARLIRRAVARADERGS